MIGRQKFQIPSASRPLTRAEAARVIAAPLPKRTQRHRYAIAGPLVFDVALALAWAYLIMLAAWEILQ